MAFTVIGELLNTSRAEVRRAVEERDAAFVGDLAAQQAACGASFVDVNAGAQPEEEGDALAWMVDVVQRRVSVPLCLDSADPDVLRAAWARAAQPPLINSVSLEPERFERMLDLVRGRDCRVIALCMDGSGLPEEAAAILRHAEALVAALESAGVPRERIYVDPLARPASTDTGHVRLAREAVRAIRDALPGAHAVCGLSNVSFGLPCRRMINRVYLTLMMEAGLDGALLDPLDTQLMACLTTTEMLLGGDDYCMAFMEAASAGRIPA